MDFLYKEDVANALNQQVRLLLVLGYPVQAARNEAPARLAASLGISSQQICWLLKTLPSTDEIPF